MRNPRAFCCNPTVGWLRRATLSCIFLECVTARVFLISVGSFAYLCGPLRGVSVFGLRGRMWCWRWFGWRRMSNFRLSCLRSTLGRRQLTRGHRPRWMLYGGRLVPKRIVRHLPSTAKHFFLCLFLRRERGHPPRRGPGLPIMGAARAECCPSRFRGRRASLRRKFRRLCLVQDRQPSSLEQPPFTSR